MLAIRFNRVGKKNKAQFRIVVQEHTIAPGGRHVEIVGSYDPHSKKGVFKNERIKYWIDKGAQVSDSVYNLLVTQSVIEGKKRFIKVSKKKEKSLDEARDKGESKPAEGGEPVESKTKTTEAKDEKTEAPTSAKGEVGGPTAENVGQKPAEIKDETPNQSAKADATGQEVKREDKKPVKSSSDDQGSEGKKQDKKEENKPTEVKTEEQKK